MQYCILYLLNENSLMPPPHTHTCLDTYKSVNIRGRSGQSTSQGCLLSKSVGALRQLPPCSWALGHKSSQAQVKFNYHSGL